MERRSPLWYRWKPRYRFRNWTEPRIANPKSKLQKLNGPNPENVSTQSNQRFGFAMQDSSKCQNLRNYFCSGIVAWSLDPPPGREEILKLPCINRTRSSMLARPTPPLFRAAA